MPKIFLSHSSANKEQVKKIYSKLVTSLGEESVVMDCFNFQEGRNTESEIIYNLDISDLFVIFFSNDALDSQWVHQELRIAESRIAKDRYYQICPIIVADKIKYDDERIPKWLRDQYNIQMIKSNKKIVDIILERYIEISRQKHNAIKDRQDLFVGRNSFLDDIERRIDDFNLPKPVALFASGLEGVGRRTFLKKSLIKTNLVKPTYPFSELAMERNESIEDFILKLIDLGFFEDEELEIKISEINELSFIEKKIALVKIISKLQEEGYFILIKDSGCIINQRGEIVDWFYDVVNSEDVKDKLIFLIASKFRYFSRTGDYNFHKIFAIKIPELEPQERNGLLNRYSKICDLILDREKLSFTSDLLSGLPEQVYYAVHKLKTIGWDKFKRESHSIIRFNTQKAELLLEDFHDNKKQLEFLALLCQFDSIGINYLFSIIARDNRKKEDYQNYLDTFLLQGICETVGTFQEYVRVNDSIKDYMIRSDYKINSKHRQLILDSVQEFISKIDENENYNVPELLFNLKISLKNNLNIDEKYIFPSIYLKTMNELYYSGRYKEVVFFADKALQRIDNYDDRMIFEIRYLLCLALAKLSKQNIEDSKLRFNEEVHNIDGPDHDFLYGFYYRQIGKYDKALERLNSSLVKRSNFSKAKREKVQVLIAMQDFPSALELAKLNYENYKNNPYHIQAYFTCLIKSDEPNKNKILQELIESMKLIKNKVSEEMTPRLQAQYFAFIENDYDSAIESIDEAIYINPDIQYATFIKFDIAEKFGDIEMMKSIISRFENSDLKSKYYNNYIYMNSLLISKIKNADEAKSYFCKNISNYTELAKERFLNRLDNNNK